MPELYFFWWYHFTAKIGHLGARHPPSEAGLLASPETMWSALSHLMRIQGIRIQESYFNNYTTYHMVIIKSSRVINLAQSERAGLAVGANPLRSPAKYNIAADCLPRSTTFLHGPRQETPAGSPMKHGCVRIPEVDKIRHACVEAEEVDVETSEGSVWILFVRFLSSLLAVRGLCHAFPSSLIPWPATTWDEAAGPE